MFLLENVETCSKIIPVTYSFLKPNALRKATIVHNVGLSALGLNVAKPILVRIYRPSFPFQILQTCRLICVFPMSFLSFIVMYPKLWDVYIAPDKKGLKG